MVMTSPCALDVSWLLVHPTQHRLQADESILDHQALRGVNPPGEPSFQSCPSFLLLSGGRSQSLRMMYKFVQ